jgi:hypothetical protein
VTVLTALLDGERVLYRIVSGWCLLRRIANGEWLSVTDVACEYGISAATVGRRKPTPFQVVDQARSVAEIQLQARRELEIIRERDNINEAAKKHHLDPEALRAAFAAEYEQHPWPETALLYAVRGMRNPAWLSEHRARTKSEGRPDGTGEGDRAYFENYASHFPEDFASWSWAMRYRFLEEKGCPPSDLDPSFWLRVLQHEGQSLLDRMVDIGGVRVDPRTGLTDADIEKAVALLA